MSLEAWGDEDGPDIERLLGEGYRSADDMTKAAHDVIDERLRQRDVEGWTPEHDDQHSRGEIAKAAACYALSGAGFSTLAHPNRYWPWAFEWWKPKSRRQDLVRAAALLLAEIERIDRLEAKVAPGHDQDGPALPGDHQRLENQSEARNGTR